MEGNLNEFGFGDSFFFFWLSYDVFVRVSFSFGFDVSDFDHTEEQAASLATGAANAAQGDAEEVAHCVTLDAPFAQTRTDAPDVVKGKTGEVDSNAEGDRDAAHDAENTVAAIETTPVHSEGSAPQPVVTAKAFRFSHQVVPQDLQMDVHVVGVSVLHVEAGRVVDAGTSVFHSWRPKCDCSAAGSHSSSFGRIKPNFARSRSQVVIAATHFGKIDRLAQLE